MEKKTIELLAPAGKFLHIPVEVIPVFIVRIFSSSAAVSFVLDIFKEYGPDSRLGMIVSIMMSCTETVIYTITIYYMSVNIKKTRFFSYFATFHWIIMYQYVYLYKKMNPIRHWIHPIISSSIL